MAEQLWNTSIAQRRPALVGNYTECPDLRQLESWSNEYLKAKAGSRVLQIEYRDDNQRSYGHGHKREMTFGQFLERLEAGDSTLYLTTQQVKPAPDGHPELYAEPVSSLVAPLPLQPQIMGNLVPQSINMWMGLAQEGTSSGLHHDFHDNLYILLRGCKRFRLWPPQQAPNMYVRGKLQRLYPNGRIVYEGQGEVLADGAAAGDVAAWRKRSAAEADVRRAEQQLEAVSRGDAVVVKGRQLSIAEARRQLDDAEARLLGVMDDIIDDGGFDTLLDDFDMMEQQTEAAAAGSAGADEYPPSFSEVDLSLPAAQLRKRYPLFPGLASAQEVVVEAGQMLYLPAGWFHEVTSFGSTTQGGHLALNYWFHPPDNLQPGTAGFRQPYSSGYWPALWAERLQRLRPGAAVEQQAGDQTVNQPQASRSKRRKQQAGQGEDTGSEADHQRHQQTRGKQGRKASAAASAVMQQEAGEDGELQIDKDLVRQLLAQYIMQQHQPAAPRKRRWRPVGRRHHVLVTMKDISRPLTRPPRPLPKR